MTNCRSFWLATILLSAVSIVGGCDDKSPTDKARDETPKLAVGIQTSPAMALVMVAQDEGLFKKAGVDVHLTQFTAGKFAMQAFLGNSLDVAVTGDVPVTLAALQGNKFRVIGQVVQQTINEVRVVAQNDGNRDPRAFFEAKPRKLATSIGGGPEFYTYNFLKKYGLTTDNVEIVSQRPEDMPAALSNGSVDAISIFDPFAAIAEQRLGNRVQTFSDPSLYSELYLIDVHNSDLSSDKRDELKAFLKGLRLAQDFIISDPADAKRVVMKYTKLDASIVDAIWKNYVFKVSLNHFYVDDTVAEARWAIGKGTFPANTPIPDYLNIAYPDLLRDVAPDQVSVGQK